MVDIRHPREAGQDRCLFMSDIQSIPQGGIWKLPGTQSRTKYFLCGHKKEGPLLLQGWETQMLSNTF